MIWISASIYIVSVKRNSMKRFKWRPKPVINSDRFDPSQEYSKTFHSLIKSLPLLRSGLLRLPSIWYFFSVSAKNQLWNQGKRCDYLRRKDRIEINFNKVNRCLASYSPRHNQQPTHQQGTKWAGMPNPKRTKMPILGKKSYFFLEKSKVLLPT